MEEKRAERIFFAMRAGRLTRNEYTEAMLELEGEGEAGELATLYCTWLLLRDVPATPESWSHWVALRTRLAHLLNEK